MLCVIYIYILYIYIYIYIYILICYVSGHKWSATHRMLRSHRSKMGVIYMHHENNVPSRLSPQWLCGNSFTWHKAIMVITGRANCFHDCIQIYIHINIFKEKIERKTASCFSGFCNYLHFQQFKTKVKCNYFESKRALTFKSRYCHCLYRLKVFQYFGRLGSVSNLISRRAFTVCTVLGKL